MMREHKLPTQPLKLLPNRVWRTYEGGLLLEAWSGAIEPKDSSFPENWIGSVIRAHNVGRERFIEGYSRFIASDGTEHLLKDCVERDPQAFLGKRHAEKYGTQTAVLVKALDSSERLTIQVHPDRRFAKQNFQSDYGKTEAWYVLGGRTINGEEPYVLLGFKQGVTREVWRRLFEEQDLESMKNALHKIPLNEGEIFLIEGGVPHAIGSGCLIIEIQEPTDLTLRTERTTPRGMLVPDHACHQGIGFDRMLDCFHYEELSYEDTMRRWKKEPRIVNTTPDGTEWKLIGECDTNCFRMYKLDISGRYRMNGTGVFYNAIIVSGAGKIGWSYGELSIKEGDSFFIPADCEFVQYVREGGTKLRILLCFPPLPPQEA
ncbi:type I phosphomannose isomerase catalytic subunit [Cohnella fermenti]|uniref:Mannose-6-phosphate isomerase n=1 Tax=Cohnella fermenti TaxID=2565925 RepID=A0A4S4BEY9_9BACL|nr:type I phosphomannose isomerase catalytic subunit [Cohnella fermenti]THF72794.1 mannose-6-phosphate isomerase [Cohnella fermenti]